MLEKIICFIQKKTVFNYKPIIYKGKRILFSIKAREFNKIEEIEWNKK